jgi:hypothetical protein
MLREKLKWRPHESESTDAEHRGGLTRSSDEAAVMGVERRGWIVQLCLMDQPVMGGIGWIKRSRTVFRNT